MASDNKIFLFSKTPYPGVNHIPILHISYLEPRIDFSDYDYIIATSKEVFSALDRIGSWTHLPVLAISDSTAEAAKAKGAKVLDVANGYGKDIVGLVREKYSALKALYPHAKTVAYDIESAVQEYHIDISSYSVYETSCSKDKALDLPGDAVCIFTSPSAVRCFEELYTFLPSYRVICIGETTRAALPKEVESFVSETSSVASTVKRAESLLA